MRGKQEGKVFIAIKTMPKLPPAHSPGPTVLPMRDREIVAAIVAGDPAGLAAAYDRYAAALHAYCRSLLSDPADAADAVQDTFIVAIARFTRLRDPDRAGAWLYAVARNECHRRLHERTTEQAVQAGDLMATLTGADLTARPLEAPPATASPLEAPPATARPQEGAAVTARPPEAGDVADQPTLILTRPERFDPRELVAAAIAALTPAERDAVELKLGHELDDDSLAVTLGLSRSQARALASRGRKHFETSLGAVLVARAGPQSCAKLADLLGGWDGNLTTELRSRVDKHINRCATCAECKRRELQAVVPLGLRPVFAPPEHVRGQVFALATDATGDAAVDRAQILRRAGSFGRSGFPLPLDPPSPKAPKGSALAAVIGIAALAALAAGTIIVSGTEHRDGSPAGTGPALQIQTPKPTAQQVAPAAAAPTPAKGPHATRHGAVPARVTTAAPTTVPPTAASPTPTVSVGTLAVSPTTVVLRRMGKEQAPTGWFTLTADGGPVASFSITVPPDHAADLTVTPATGSLAAGQSVQVRVTLRDSYRGTLRTELSVQPGGLTVTVIYGKQPRAGKRGQRIALTLARR